MNKSKGCNLLNPYLLTVLLPIPFDKLPFFLSQNNLSLIVRAHQVVEDGYEFFHERSLVTLFSAPNYCGQFDNAGALMMVKEDLTCSFVILPVSN